MRFKKSFSTVAGASLCIPSHSCFSLWPHMVSGSFSNKWIEICSTTRWVRRRRRLKARRRRCELSTPPNEERKACVSTESESDDLKESKGTAQGQVLSKLEKISGSH